MRHPHANNSDRLDELACYRITVTRRPGLVLTSLAVLSCLACSSERGPVPPPRVASDEGTAEPSFSPSPARPAETAPLVLGWSTIPGAPTPAADAHNRRGLKLHRAKEYEQSLAAFDEALAVEPDYAWARYNRACALARLERFEAAAAELERLLREDLPRFGPRLRGDEDLAALRRSALGEALEHTHEQIAAAYLAAVATGVTAVIYREVEYDFDARRGLAAYDHLRLGVYDHQQGRFVPLSPELPTALGGWLDRATNRLLIVSGDVVSGDVWVVQPWNVGVHVFDLASLGVPINEAEAIDRRRPQTKTVREGVSVALEGDAVRLTYHRLDYADWHDLTLLIEAGKSSLVAETWEIGRDEAEERRMAAQRELHLSNDQAHLHIDGHGVQRHLPAAAGVQVRKRQVFIDGLAEPIELAAAHRQVTSTRIERTDDGRFVLVVGHLAACAKDGAELLVVASRIDLETGSATLLAKTRRAGGAELGADGSVFFDDGQRVVRFPPESSEGLADVLAGVRFAIPSYHYSCSI